MPKMMHIDPDEFLLDTFRLGQRIYEQGFRPKHAISIWRGGTPVGLGVDAYFRSRGVHISHTTIATASYTGMGQQGQVTVKNLEHLARVICPEDGLLIIDDVYESGNTIKRIVEVLRARRDLAPLRGLPLTLPRDDPQPWARHLGSWSSEDDRRKRQKRLARARARARRG